MRLKHTHKERVVAIRLQQWLRKCATVLRYMHSAYLCFELQQQTLQPLPISITFDIGHTVVLILTTVCIYSTTV